MSELKHINVGESWLAHHGIKGQQWGVQNGPPYPLDDNPRKQDKLHKKYVKEFSKELTKSAAKGDYKDVQDKLRTHPKYKEYSKSKTNEIRDDIVNSFLGDYKNKKVFNSAGEKESLENIAKRQLSDMKYYDSALIIDGFDFTPAPRYGNKSCAFDWTSIKGVNHYGEAMTELVAEPGNEKKAVDNFKKFKSDYDPEKAKEGIAKEYYDTGRISEYIEYGGKTVSRNEFKKSITLAEIQIFDDGSYLTTYDANENTGWHYINEEGKVSDMKVKYRSMNG